MTTDTNNLVSITDANRNFSQVVRKVEKDGDVIILKNNRPQYVVSKFENISSSQDLQILTIIAKMILTEHHDAFEELAK